MAAGLAVLIALGGVVRPAAAQVRTEGDARKIGVQDQLQLTITVEGSACRPDSRCRRLTISRSSVDLPSHQMSFVKRALVAIAGRDLRAAGRRRRRAEVGFVKVGDSTAPAIPIEVVPARQTPTARARPQRSFGDDPFGSILGRGRQPEPSSWSRPSRAAGVVVGEPLLLTYYLYTRRHVTGLQFVDAPQFGGSGPRTCREWGQPKDEPTHGRGVNYHRFPIMMKLLFPTKAGRLTIPASS